MSAGPFRRRSSSGPRWSTLRNGPKEWSEAGLIRRHEIFDQEDFIENGRLSYHGHTLDIGSGHGRGAAGMPPADNVRGEGRAGQNTRS